MTQRSHILQELEELNSRLPAADPGASQPYQVPAGYFEALPGLLLQRIKALEASTVKEETTHMAPSLSHLPRTLPFTVPDGYFDQLPEQVLARVQAEQEENPADELARLSPLLGGLKKETPYQVPAGYFSEVAVPRSEKPAPVVSLFRRPVIRLAAAAVVTGIIALTAWLFISQGPETGEKAVARFEKNLNKELHKMSDQELSDFIQLTDPEAGLKDEVAAAPAVPELKDWLKDIPEQDLKNFLDETAVSENADESIMLN